MGAAFAAFPSPRTVAPQGATSPAATGSAAARSALQSQTLRPLRLRGAAPLQVPLVHLRQPVRERVGRRWTLGGVIFGSHAARSLARRLRSRLPSTKPLRAAVAGRSSQWNGWVYGPLPPEPPLTPDELYQAEFAREFQRAADPRMTTYSDNVRQCAESGDWQGAIRVLEDMWRCQLEPDAWSYSSAIDACIKANETESLKKADALKRELKSWGPIPNVMRFQIAPNVRWQREMKQAGCGIHNSLDWKGRDPLPTTPHPCWLLPGQDDNAEHVAEHEVELRQAGWKIMTGDLDLMAMLRNKAALHEHAEKLGLSDLMPTRYTMPGEAVYPCVLKPSKGTWGKETHIVYSSEEVLRLSRPGKVYEIERQIEQQAEYMTNYYEQAGQQRDSEDSMAERAEQTEKAIREWISGAEWEEVEEKWVMQELVPGQFEYSTALLVEDGKILDAICSRYEYPAEVYVWPALEYDRADYVSVPDTHLSVMSALLTKGFSGICNFNYKLRHSGQLCIFECNPRVGGDIVFDAPKERVRIMFEKLDAMCS